MSSNSSFKRCFALSVLFAVELAIVCQSDAQAGGGAAGAKGEPRRGSDSLFTPSPSMSAELAKQAAARQEREKRLKKLFESKLKQEVSKE